MPGPMVRPRSFRRRPSALTITFQTMLQFQSTSPKSTSTLANWQKQGTSSTPLSIWRNALDYQTKFRSCSICVMLSVMQRLAVLSRVLRLTVRRTHHLRCYRMRGKDCRPPKGLSYGRPF